MLLYRCSLHFVERQGTNHNRRTVMIKSYKMAALAALSLTATPAIAQSAAGAASSSSSSAASASAASVTNKGQLQLIPGTAIGVAAAPTASCMRTKGFGISIPFFGISTSAGKPDKECQFVQMLDRTMLIGSMGPPMACQMAYNHWNDWRAASDTLGVDCRNLMPQAAPPPPPPMIVAAPPPPPAVVTRVETHVVYVTRPLHRRVVKRKLHVSCGCKR